MMYVLAESEFQIPMFTRCSYIIHLSNQSWEGLEVYVNKTDQSINSCNVKHDVYAKRKKLISICGSRILSRQERITAITCTIV